MLLVHDDAAAAALQVAATLRVQVRHQPAVLAPAGPVLLAAASMAFSAGTLAVAALGDPGALVEAVATVGFLGFGVVAATIESLAVAVAIHGCLVAFAPTVAFAFAPGPVVATPKHLAAPAALVSASPKYPAASLAAVVAPAAPAAATLNYPPAAAAAAATPHSPVPAALPTPVATPDSLAAPAAAPVSASPHTPASALPVPAATPAAASAGPPSLATSVPPYVQPPPTAAPAHSSSRRPDSRPTRTGGPSTHTPHFHSAAAGAVAVKPHQMLWPSPRFPGVRMYSSAYPCAVGIFRLRSRGEK